MGGTLPTHLGPGAFGCVWAPFPGMQPNSISMSPGVDEETAEWWRQAVLRWWPTDPCDAWAQEHKCVLPSPEQCRNVPENQLLRKEQGRAQKLPPKPKGNEVIPSNTDVGTRHHKGLDVFSHWYGPTNVSWNLYSAPNKCSWWEGMPHRLKLWFYFSIKLSIKLENLILLEKVNILVQLCFLDHVWFWLSSCTGLREEPNGAVQNWSRVENSHSSPAMILQFSPGLDLWAPTHVLLCASGWAAAKFCLKHFRDIVSFLTATFLHW